MKFKIGDYAYTYVEYNGVEKVKITNIINNTKGKNYYKICFGKFNGISSGAYEKDLYITKEECKKARKDKINTILNEYRSQITDIKSLVKFMFTHNISSCEEYTDWKARDVVIEKAKEFGIDLGVI